MCNVMRLIISCPLRTESQKLSSLESSNLQPPHGEQDFPAGITLRDFPGTSAEKQEALRIFTSYADVFARDGEYLGRNMTIQQVIDISHQIT